MWSVGYFIGTHQQCGHMDIIANFSQHLDFQYHNILHKTTNPDIQSAYIHLRLVNCWLMKVYKLQTL